MGKVAEFRGCDCLYVAEIEEDSASTYDADTPVKLCEVAQIAKSTDQTSETHFYDNVAAITIKAVGADTIQLIVPAMVLTALAKITGAGIDQETGAYIDRGNANEQKTYALGYRLKLTDGTFRYVWRLKGTFSAVPDETSDTESDQISTNNQTVQFTAIDTIHKFTDGKTARSFVCDERDGLANLSIAAWFNYVKTPDDKPAPKSEVTVLTLSESTLSIEEGSNGTLTYSVTPSNIVPEINTSNRNVAPFAVHDNTITVHGYHAGTAIITASAGNKSVSCTVTVTDA